tara:strand:- start:87 stop:674 length:588 start_codon:yes stop_codon:yes gene_type:complete
MDYKKLYLQTKRQYLKHKHIIKGGSSGHVEANETKEGYNSDSSNFSDVGGRSIFQNQLSNKRTPVSEECNYPSFKDFKEHGDNEWLELVAKINEYKDENKYLSCRLDECSASLESKEIELEECSASLKLKETELQECIDSLQLKEIELEECVASLSSEEKSYKTLYKEQREQIAKQNIKIVELEGEICKRNFDME